MRTTGIWMKLALLSLSVMGLSAVVWNVAEKPLMAQGANFEERSLQPGFSEDEGTLSGHTGGSYSLAAISNRDAQGQACLGYGDSRPDHIVELKSDFAGLTFQVESGGKDTALLIQGPGGVRCGEDASAVNLDDQIMMETLKAGRYSIWVGTMEPGNRQNYRLMVKEK